MNKKSLFIIFGYATFILVVFFVFMFNKKSTDSLALKNEIFDEYQLEENQNTNIQENRYGISEKEYFRQIREERVTSVKIEQIKKEEIIEEIESFKPFDFVVIADSESYSTPNGYNKEFESILVKASSYKSNFAIFSGDIITLDTANKNRVINVKNLIEKYFKNYYIAFGKHDVTCENACVDVWQSVLFNKKYSVNDKRKIYHSFDYENTHFVLLSSDFPIKHTINDEQLNWLDDDLKKNDKLNVIVISHVPPVTFFEESVKDKHDMTYNVVQRDKLLAILRKYRVDLVISGHEHVFDHKVVDGIDYVLAGAVGKSKRYKDSIWKDSFLYITVSGNRIVLKSFGLDGELIREIRIK